MDREERLKTEKAFRELSHDELLDMLSADENNYEPEMHMLLMEEARRRGIADKIDDYKVTKRLEEESSGKQSRWVNWFTPITTERQALAVIKDTSFVFYFLAVLHIVLGIFLQPAAVLDGVFCAILAFLLWRFKSRVIAVILLFYSLGSAVVTVVNILLQSAGGRNIFMAVLVIGVTVRAVKATFTLQRLKGYKRDTGRLGKRLLIAGVISGVLGLFGFLGIIFLMFFIFGDEAETFIASPEGTFFAMIAGLTIISFFCGVVLAIIGTICMLAGRSNKNPRQS